MLRRWQWVQLVVVRLGRHCLLLELSPRRSLPAGPWLPYVRFSVALPPGIGRRRGPGLPRRRKHQGLRYIVWRRRLRVQLVVVRVGGRCLPLELLRRRSLPAEQRLPCVRFSVALPPGIGCRAAPGLRAYQYGTLYNVGNAGYIWSSTIPTGSGNAHNLNFNYGGINPQNNNNRAYGFQLRCLQAFTAVLPVFYDSVVGANMCEIMKINML